MSYRNPNESEDAQSRIDRIRGGGSQPAQPEQPAYQEPPASPARASRAQPSGAKASAGRSAAAPSRGSQAILFIAAIVIVGIVVVGALILFSGALGGGGGLSIFATETPTPTSTFTPTPTPTETATPTATATPEAPRLTLPPLTCIFQSGVGCADYCANAANTAECNSARSFIENQGASFDSWLSCLAPGSGANVGNPQDCLVQAWYARNVPPAGATAPVATATP